MSQESNCVHLFCQSISQRKCHTALWTMKDGSVDFQTLHSLAGQAQKLCRKKGIHHGDSVLVFDNLSPALYAAIIAILAMGATVVFVEPWMPLRCLRQVIETIQPKLFLTNPLGMLWGLRSSAIRSIPKWSWLQRAIKQETADDLRLEPVAGLMPAIVTFTTGTTGDPKGVVRHHQGLIAQQATLSRVLQLDHFPGADLCLFGNLALSNLASGKASLIVPKNWNHSFFQSLHHLPQHLQPQSVTCGPSFLRELLRHNLPSLQAFHVGGALTDCDIFERAFQKWPEAHWLHVYGSSEAEPVCCIDAKQAVACSRKKGFFQTLCLGNPVPEIRIECQADQTWVSGPYVCPYYLGNPVANTQSKKQDISGNIWHNMGDRLAQEKGFYWYRGRLQQSENDFLLEQQLYNFMQSSTLFIHNLPNGRKIVIGQNIQKSKDAIKQVFTEIDDVIEAKILRDRRHRARIDRVATIKNARLLDSG